MKLPKDSTLRIDRVNVIYEPYYEKFNWTPFTDILSDVEIVED